MQEEPGQDPQGSGIEMLLDARSSPAMGGLSAAQCLAMGGPCSPSAMAASPSMSGHGGHHHQRRGSTALYALGLGGAGTPMEPLSPAEQAPPPEELEVVRGEEGALLHAREAVRGSALFVGGLDRGTIDRGWAGRVGR